MPIFPASKHNVLSKSQNYARNVQDENLSAEMSSTEWVNEIWSLADPIRNNKPYLKLLEPPKMRLIVSPKKD